MKNILNIKYNKLNHLEQLLRQFDFYKKYKIGAVVDRYGDIDELTLGKNYKKDGKYKIYNLEIIPHRITNNYDEVHGHYDDDCSRHHSEKYLVLSKHKDLVKLTINTEYISGPYTEGYEHYEYGDGDEPMEDFAYGVIGSRYTLFSLPETMADDEIILN